MLYIINLTEQKVLKARQLMKRLETTLSGADEDIREILKFYSNNGFSEIAAEKAYTELVKVRMHIRATLENDLNKQYGVKGY